MNTGRVSSILFACALAACGVGGSPDDPNNDGKTDEPGPGPGSGSNTDPNGLTATKFLEEIAKKFCDEAFTCKASFPTDAGVTFDEVFGTSAQMCYADAAAAYPPATVEAQIAAGKIKWNAADAATCLSGIMFGTCQQYWQEGANMPAACDTALVGTVADGGACMIDFECQNPMSYCDDTSKKCTQDQTGSRTVPTTDVPLHVQSALLR